MNNDSTTVKHTPGMVTIWSRSASRSHWVIERTHTKDYCKCLIGVNDPGECIEMSGRIYLVCEEGVNPNN
jgi:hypothetical protein